MKEIIRGNVSLSLKLLSVVTLCVTLSAPSVGANTIKYSYDALGRLTFVDNPLNGNRDYDYDKAGNRLKVSQGTANDAAAEPSGTPPAQPSASVPAQPGSTTIPAPPTGLFSTQNSPCSWSASWSGSLGTINYKFRDASGLHTLTVNSPYVPLTANTVSVAYGFSSCSISQPLTEKPLWVQACNAVGCSSQINFP